MAKLTLKYGDVSIEYDGPEVFLKDELPSIVKAMADLRALGPAAPPPSANPATGAGGALPADVKNASVSTVAQKLGVSTGPELIAAAAFTLALGGTPAFKRLALRTKAREAKTYWKKTYGNNFDNYLNRLVGSGRLNHLGGDDYAIPDTEQASLGTRLAAAK